MKKTLVASLVMSLVLAFAASAPAAEPSKIGSSTLASMGLGGMKQISDNEGMAVRGKGFALAGGWGLAAARWQHSAIAGSTNGYLNGNKQFSGGANFSIGSAGPVMAISGGFSLGGGF